MAIVRRTPPEPPRESAADRGHVPTGDPYTDLPWDGPHTPVLGHALITMVEPHEGHEHAYNRWYEDSHFFNGALQEPWMFAGRRWVAPRALQELRRPATSPVAEPLENGKYLGTYWVTQGRVEEHKRWTSAANSYLVSIGDVNRDRTHVFTSFQDRVGTVYVDETVPHDMFSLMDPSPGLVLEVFDAPSADERGALEDWILDEHLPSRITPGGPVWCAILFRVNPPFKGMKPENYAALQGVANEGRRVTVLWFLTEDPRACWDFFEQEIELAHRGGRGEATLVAPFVPARMGTTLYEDQLR
ncbi:hypothetical protein [Microbacterium sp. No. 7]|uniref:hypothetical protein n=1 Tax=Microbacterium sp. No. 7 TaxID=1714373 RepID=UPI0006ED0DD1|nr:hypothetical protein [Microbacterium sp. No. 7]ALJ18896.1 hypothetical protein AOA12_02815 [Microbacterium sp. No. 7]